MKIAVLYSGYPNYLTSCFNSHQRNVFTFFEKNSSKVDLFGHFWKTPNSIINFSEDYQFIDSKPIFTKFKISDQLSEEILNYKNYKADKLFPTNILSMLSQTYSWRESWRLMEKYEREINEEYDLIVRIRPDEYFTSQLNYPYVISSQCIYLKDMFVHLNFGLNDHFAFGERKLMFEYMNLYEHIFDLIDKGCPVNLELLLGFQLRIIKNIDIEKLDIEFDLYRRIFN